MDKHYTNNNNNKKEGHKDDEKRSRKLFIGGVSFSTSDEDFFKYFAKFGELEDCVLIREKDTGQSRGFGFVTYKDQNVSDHVAEQQLYLDGRRLDPKPSISRYNMDQIHEHRNQTTKVFVGGLHDDTAEAELSEHFTKFGEVLEVNIMYDRFTNAPRGFGFVTFKEADVAHKVITYDEDHMIHNKKVDCKPATARKDAFNREIQQKEKDPKASSREERWRKYHGDNDELGAPRLVAHDAANVHPHSSYAAHYGAPSHSSYAHSSAIYPAAAARPHYAAVPHSSYAAAAYPQPHYAPAAHPPHHMHPPAYEAYPPHYDPYYRAPPHSYAPPIAPPKAARNPNESSKSNEKASVTPQRYEAYPAPQYPPPQYPPHVHPRYDYYAQYHAAAAAAANVAPAAVNKTEANKVDVNKTIPAYGASRGSKATNSAQTKRYSAY